MTNLEDSAQKKWYFTKNVRKLFKPFVKQTRKLKNGDIAELQIDVGKDDDTVSNTTIDTQSSLKRSQSTGFVRFDNLEILKYFGRLTSKKKTNEVNNDASCHEDNESQVFEQQLSEELKTDSIEKELKIGPKAKAPFPSSKSVFEKNGFGPDVNVTCTSGDKQTQPSITRLRTTAVIDTTISRSTLLNKTKSSRNVQNEIPNDDSRKKKQNDDMVLRKERSFAAPSPVKGILEKDADISEKNKTIKNIAQVRNDSSRANALVPEPKGNEHERNSYTVKVTGSRVKDLLKAEAELASQQRLKDTAQSSSSSTTSNKFIVPSKNIPSMKRRLTALELNSSKFEEMNEKRISEMINSCKEDKPKIIPAAPKIEQSPPPRTIDSEKSTPESAPATIPIVPKAKPKIRLKKLYEPYASRSEDIVQAQDKFANGNVKNESNNEVKIQEVKNKEAKNEIDKSKGTHHQLDIPHRGRGNSNTTDSKTLKTESDAVPFANLKKTGRLTVLLQSSKPAVSSSMTLLPSENKDALEKKIVKLGDVPTPQDSRNYFSRMEKTHMQTSQITKMKSTL